MCRIILLVLVLSWLNGESSITLEKSSRTLHYYAAGLLERSRTMTYFKEHESIFCAGAASVLFMCLSVVVCAAPSDSTQDLINAVRSDDYGAVERLIVAGVDVRDPQGDGATALHWSVHRDNEELSALLLSAGADINASDDHGLTPLALACLNGASSMVERLLTFGADPTLARTTGETPLMTAARVGNLDVVRRLLAAGADPTATESFRGQTALMWAVAENQTAVAQVILEVGGGADSRTTNGFSPLLFAAQQGNVDIARMLLSAGADVNESAPDGIGGDTNTQELFRQDTSASALMVAIDSGHSAMAKFLIERGADVNDSGAGRTPLHSATQQEMPAVVRALLSAGADPNVRLERRLPLLSRAITQDNGLTPSIIGATPFLLAASYGDVETMQILIDAGADPFMMTEDGTTALMLAAGTDYVDGQDKYGHRSYPAFLETLQRRAFEATKYCLELGLNINAVNDSGLTALFGAVYMGGTLIAPYLVQRGAAIDVINLRGQTPWMVAAKGEYRSGSFYTQEETAEVLEKLGADTALGSDLGRDFRQLLE